MKYSSTTRLINVVIFALLFCIFGAAGVYFGFFVCPDYFAVSHFTSQFTSIGIEQAGYFSGFSFAFPAALGVLGIAGMAASILGLLNSVKALLDERNDELVVKSFMGYIRIAYIVAAFFAVNALLFYNVYGKGVTGWWITICVILVIAALIGGNVPMMKLLEDKNQNYLVSLIFETFAIIGFSMVAVAFLPTIAVLASKSVTYNLGLKLESILECGAFLGILSTIGAVLARKNIKEGKDSKAASIVGVAGLGSVGLSLISIATYDHLYNTNHNTFDKTWKNNWDLVLTPGTGVSSNNKIPTDFLVMAFIVGILLVLAAIAFIVYTLVGDKKKAAR